MQWSGLLRVKFEPPRRKDAMRLIGMHEPNQKTDHLASQVVDAALEVYRNLGAGFLESVYEKALCHELMLRGIRFENQKPIHLSYKDVAVGEAILDLLVDEKLVVELKAVDTLHPIHHAQVLNYLKATKLELGLLMNFNVKLLRDGIKRIVLTQ